MLPAGLLAHWGIYRRLSSLPHLLPHRLPQTPRSLAQMEDVAARIERLKAETIKLSDPARSKLDACLDKAAIVARSRAGAQLSVRPRVLDDIYGLHCIVFAAPEQTERHCRLAARRSSGVLGP
jgi:hypothetical protein